MAQRGLVFVVLLGIWIVLSGNLDAFHLLLGVVSCAFVTLISGDLIFAGRGKSVPQFLREGARFLGYVPWLMVEVVKANMQVLRLALLPGAMRQVRPEIVRYQTSLKSDFARFVFANSITLTPGTITLDMLGDELYVHAINPEMAAGLGGEMERRIARIFAEEEGK